MIGVRKPGVCNPASGSIFNRRFGQKQSGVDNATKSEKAAYNNYLKHDPKTPYFMIEPEEGPIEDFSQDPILKQVSLF